MLSAERLKDLIEYDPNSGTFTWIKTQSNRAKAGSITAKCRDSKGYCVIRIDSDLHRAHRLAYLYMKGVFPDADVDHINGVRDDNRWLNLRAATRSENTSNRPIPKANTSGVKGVCWNTAHKRWLATITHKGRQIYLGEFKCIEKAAAVVSDARHRLHGEFARID